MSPALAYECPDTPCSPAVQATCQGGAVHAPGAPPGGGPPSHAQVEAPCSVLAVDTAEERLCPCTSGSTMLRAGDKQLRAAPRSYKPQGAQSSAPSLTTTTPLGRAARGGWARGLRSGHAQAYATQPGLPGLGAALGSCPSARRPNRSPGLGRRTPLPRPRRGQVWKLFARQGGLLGIATQEPNWSRSPSLLGPSWSSVSPMAVEVCAWLGSADVEH